MKLLFCNISWMEYYKGITEKDKPINGGSFVTKTGMANEDLNFCPIEMEDGNEYCFGFVETKSTNRKDKNQLHIENIDGCKHLRDADSVDNVLVIFCALAPFRTDYTCIVGWYEHATVYRYYQEFDLGDNDSRVYNILARCNDVVLLPHSTRVSNRPLWMAPRNKGQHFGFGQSEVWYATDDKAYKDAYLNRIINQIQNYNGDNWLYK